MKNVRTDTRGQATVLTLIFLTALLGITAFVLDVGSWYHASRQLQAEADAAALAGAQALPESTGNAIALAQQYADKNGGGLSSSGITFSGSSVANDTISVDMTKPADGFFSKVFGIDTVTVHAKAAARAGAPNQARWAAPIGVDIKHPLLSGSGCPCFQQSTTLDLQKVGPGSFRLLNLDGSRGGTGPGVLAGWMLQGFDGWMPLGNYYSDPGAKFNSSQMQSAIQARIGSELLFPVYDTISGNGANLTYHVIGWVGFHLTGFSARGNSGQLLGWFTRVIWQGIQNQKGAQTPDFGVRAIQLVQ